MLFSYFTQFSLTKITLVIANQKMTIKVANLTGLLRHPVVVGRPRLPHRQAPASSLGHPKIRYTFTFTKMVTMVNTLQHCYSQSS